jgi:hypothetical protein
MCIAYPETGPLSAHDVMNCIKICSGTIGAEYYTSSATFLAIKRWKSNKKWKCFDNVGVIGP